MATPVFIDLTGVDSPSRLQRMPRTQRHQQRQSRHTPLGVEIIDVDTLPPPRPRPPRPVLREPQFGDVFITGTRTLPLPEPQRIRESSLLGLQFPQALPQHDFFRNFPAPHNLLDALTGIPRGEDSRRHFPRFRMAAGFSVSSSQVPFRLSELFRPPNPEDMDYEAVAEDCKKPPSAAPGFTRSFDENSILTCPSCSHELGSGDSDEKAVFAGKCGHVYCGPCAAGFRTEKSKGSKSIRCLVAQCKRTISGPKALFEIYI